jgi:hypothetical protein
MITAVWLKAGVKSRMENGGRMERGWRTWDGKSQLTLSRWDWKEERKMKKKEGANNRRQQVVVVAVAVVVVDCRACPIPLLVVVYCSQIFLTYPTQYFLFLGIVAVAAIGWLLRQCWHRSIGVSFFAQYRSFTSFDGSSSPCASFQS